MAEPALRRRTELACRNLFVGDDAILAMRGTGIWMDFDGPHAAPAIVTRVDAALAAGTPLSLIRIGNGEGNAVAMLAAGAGDAEFDAFDVEFVSQNGRSIDRDAASALSQAVVDAIGAADIQGYRLGRFDEAALIRDCIDRAQWSPAFGLIHARALLARRARAGGTAWFTSAWIHLDLLARLGPWLDAAPAVIVVTGRADLQPVFADRLSGRLRRFVAVPVQGYRPVGAADAHTAMFGHVCAMLRREAGPRTLVLVGAGLFGKVYCHEAQRAGAVAIDLGSAFDLMAGVATRPVHRGIDLAAVRWATVRAATA